MEKKTWVLTINLVSDACDKPLESLSLEMRELVDCNKIIKTFNENGITFMKDAYFKFTIE